MSRLVVSRFVGERIWINGGQIKVEIVGVQGNKIRVRIEAPPEVEIDREEVALRKQAEKAA